jgi:outer membrane lipoprotein-sorting protein
MKILMAFVFVALVAAVAISGCVQQTPVTGGETSGKMTASQMEQQAANTLEEEMEQAIGDITLEDLENELLAQG